MAKDALGHGSEYRGGSKPRSKVGIARAKVEAKAGKAAVRKALAGFLKEQKTAQRDAHKAGIAKMKAATRGGLDWKLDGKSLFAFKRNARGSSSSAHESGSIGGGGSAGGGAAGTGKGPVHVNAGKGSSHAAPVKAATGAHSAGVRSVGSGFVHSVHTGPIPNAHKVSPPDDPHGISGKKSA